MWKGLDNLLPERRFPDLMALVVQVSTMWTATDVVSVKRAIESQFTDARVDVVVSGREGAGSLPGDIERTFCR